MVEEVETMKMVYEQMECAPTKCIYLAESEQRHLRNTSPVKEKDARVTQCVTHIIPCLLQKQHHKSTLKFPRGKKKNEREKYHSDSLRTWLHSYIVCFSIVGINFNRPWIIHILSHLDYAA